MSHTPTKRVQLLNEVVYQTSRYCPNANCVEAAVLPDGSIALRDSKDRNKPPHIFTAEEWEAFVAGVKDGDFDFCYPRQASQIAGQGVGLEQQSEAT